jgi:hypothetical protein
VGIGPELVQITEPAKVADHFTMGESRARSWLAA